MQNRVLQEAVEILEEQERAAVGLGRPRVAYLGPKYSHSYDAAVQAFPGGEFIACQTFRAIFERIYEGEADYGILPSHNSITGSINEPLGELFEWTDKDLARRITAYGDHFMRIRNYLAAKPGTVDRSIQIVYTKDEAHRQCAEWLAKHNLDRVEHVGSTSQAAEIVRDDKRFRSAAICTKSAAEHMGLDLVVPEAVTDDPTNTTRFLKLKLSEAPTPSSDASGQDVTLLFLVLQNVPHILNRILSIFGRQGFNLTPHFTHAPLKVKMRISPEFHSWFLLEFEATTSDHQFKRSLNRLYERRNLYHAMKVVGSFRTARVEEVVAGIE